MPKPRGPLPQGFEPFDEDKMPQHIAIIMDGNGRWAKQHGKIRALGHRAGMERMVEVVRTSSDIGLSVLSLYAFSTENWKRPRLEVDALFSLLVEFIRREIDNLHKNNVKLVVMGDVAEIPGAALSEVKAGVAKTSGNTGLVLNIALNYGGRQELVRAVQGLAEKVANQEISVSEIGEEAIRPYLYTAELPDPDVLIRTSGEQRISNFMLWQLAYTELVFCEEHWPDFTNQVYWSCIQQYMARERRFGAIGGK